MHTEQQGWVGCKCKACWEHGHLKLASKLFVDEQRFSSEHPLYVLVTMVGCNIRGCLHLHHFTWKQQLFVALWRSVYAYLAFRLTQSAGFWKHFPKWRLLETPPQSLCVNGGEKVNPTDDVKAIVRIKRLQGASLATIGSYWAVWLYFRCRVLSLLPSSNAKPTLRSYTVVLSLKTPPATAQTWTLQCLSVVFCGYLRTGIVKGSIFRWNYLVWLISTSIA